ncbi:hypothetical protein MHYP_G00149970 [Metynnis hypsauchen]
MITELLSYSEALRWNAADNYSTCLLSLFTLQTLREEAESQLHSSYRIWIHVRTFVLRSPSVTFDPPSPPFGRRGFLCSIDGRKSARKEKKANRAGAKEEK